MILVLFLNGGGQVCIYRGNARLLVVAIGKCFGYDARFIRLQLKTIRSLHSFLTYLEHNRFKHRHSFKHTNVPLLTMRSILASVAAALPAVHAANAALNLASVDDNRMVQLDGILKFPVTGNLGSAPDVITKRQNGSPLGNQLRGNFYTIPLSIGTPGNRVDVVFDTGSWELWVDPNCAKARTPAFCAQFGRLTKSSSLQYLNSQTNLTYGTGWADIEYAQDTVAVGSARIQKQIFGVARDSAFWETGILGAGPSPRGFNDPDRPYLFIDTLAKEGITKSRAFGLDLAGIDSDRGSVVFGGVDTKKFRGTLERLPIVPGANAPDGASRYWVNLDGISLSAGGQTTQVIGRQVVFLDSGAQVATFPEPIVNQIVSVFPGAKIDQNGQYQVDCGMRQSQNTLDFQFGKTTIKVSYYDFIYQYPGTNYCYLGVRVAYEKMYSLGDSFLRSAYVVYDQDHQELSVAQGDDCGTNLVAIGPGPAGALVGDCSKPTSTSSAATSKPTSSATSSSASTSTKSTSATQSQVTSKTSSAASSAPTKTKSNTKSHTKSETKTKTKSHTKSLTNSPTETGTGVVTPTSKATVSGVFTNSTIPASASSTASASGSPTPTTYTSTYTTTKVHTITSCPPIVTNCPIGHKTTEIIVVTTTWCPEEGSSIKNAPTGTAVPVGPGCNGRDCPPVGPSSSAGPQATSGPAAASTFVNVPSQNPASSVPGAGQPTGSSSAGVQPAASVPVVAGAPRAFRGTGITLLGAATLTVLALL